MSLLLSPHTISERDILSPLKMIIISELGPVHTGTISYRSTSVRSKKWYGEGLRSHGYGKNQSVRSKTGPEIGRYGKVNQKLERYDRGEKPAIGQFLRGSLP